MSACFLQQLQILATAFTRHLLYFTPNNKKKSNFSAYTLCTEAFYHKAVNIVFTFFPGVITRYEVFLRGPMESQNLSSPAVERKVFFSSGWLDPSVSPDTQLTNRSTVSPPESRAIVAGLQAFSTYQMRVVSINMAGSVTSVWTTARTMEGGAYRL